MPYFLRFMLYNRYPQPHYKPLGADTFVDEEPRYEQGKGYRLRLVGSTDDITTWPEFVVIKTATQVKQQATIIAVFVVLSSEYEQFVEPRTVTVALSELGVELISRQLKLLGKQPTVETLY